MKAPDGYRLGKLLASNHDSELFSGWRESDEREVWLKRYLADRPTKNPPSVLPEFEALRAAAGKGVPEAIEVSTSDEGPVLVMERVPGTPLAAWLQEKRATELQFLEVALGLSAVLARVHDARFVHRKVNPRASGSKPRRCRSSWPTSASPGRSAP